jgi:hypothetical protein
VAGPGVSRRIPDRSATLGVLTLATYLISE